MQKFCLYLILILIGVISSLVPVSPGRKKLVKKKAFPAHLVIFLIAAFLSVVSCKTGLMQDKMEIWEGSSLGWLYDDTLRVSAFGVPEKHLTDINKKKFSACEAAVINARHRMIEMIRRERFKSCTGVVDDELTGIAAQKKLAGLFRKGTVITREYDETGNCEIIYQVKEKGLKKKICTLPD